MFRHEVPEQTLNDNIYPLKFSSCIRFESTKVVYNLTENCEVIYEK